ncbi:glutathione S-transferase family protein [Nordella sp. HKS 07]|uniref:glutathione S-transferase family protein n=1 Tax=Nordella sp. HKS 07 TaxID=2712222 RepID=UPI0013E13012|nr:glutathione S-transferase family protein [Nordella sp. HKS 07]QIG49331.1 glutathione S-transferase family protein [Nordella sp. HKS 07]
MSLTLYSHPLASFCHKVLIALYENGTAFRAETVDLGDPGSAAAHMERWPVGKMPVLFDGQAKRVIPETSIIIEYLHEHHPGPVALLPTDSEARLQARLWDRFFDLYVNVPMAKIVTDRIRPQGKSDPFGVAEARDLLDTAYGMIDGQMSARHWAIGDEFTIADCAAAPALFYAAIVHPFRDDQHHLARYRNHLLERPSVERVIAEARPYFSMFPYRDAMPAHYLNG